MVSTAFGPSTTWYGQITDQQIRAMAVLYRGLSTPTLLALADAELSELKGLCQKLVRTVDRLGLNVKCDNLAAIRCYRALGFQASAQYEKYVVLACGGRRGRRRSAGR
ncbi:MAG: hypothetical protein ACYC6Y_17680 [Thermoguttaceae bacterium]